MLGFSRRKTKDESAEEQLEEFSRLSEVGRSYYVKMMGEACDRLQEAQGDFGRSSTNPVPVNGPPGEIKYLSRLRCSCGCGLMFHRLGSLQVAGIKGDIDVYECVCLEGKHWDVLYLHPYHPRRSLITPERYSLAPFHPVFSKLVIGCGDNSFCEHFPFHLPGLIRSRYDPLIARAVLGSVEKAVSKEHKFRRPDDHSARVASINCAGRTQPAQKPRSMEGPDLTRIEGYLREGLFAEALSKLSELPEEDRNHWNILYLTGQCHRFLGDCAKAEVYHARAVAANPREAPLLLALGITLQLQSKLDDAIAALARAIECDPDHAEAYNSLALTQKKKGLLQEAVQNYDSGLKALARRIVKGMNNNPDSRIIKYTETRGQQWLEYAMQGALYLASVDGVSSVAWPSGEMAMEEERTEAHKGLYYIDRNAVDGKSTRLFLPNFFNTFRKTLQANRLYADLIGNRGSVLEAMGKKEEALMSYEEAEEFLARGAL